MAWLDAGYASPLPTATSEEAEVGRCIRNAARGQRWLEKTLWGLRDQEGGWIGAEIQNSNGSHDLGPLQINSWWIPKLAELLDRPPAQIRIWLRDDPCFNAEAARWIFASALSTTGDYWKSVGIYHSPKTLRQLRYAARVSQHLMARFGPAVFRSNPH
ncbi:MAG: murein transglycosylase [Cereibacter sphaeroides]|uniref:Murein transglycosylase n=1 Tax=Cereibacter sphaeroides TaxID=1063 RepID=A0A2W5S3S2_CERSP|nr:MAG: murein transglycosylase [Cereibacter sphaeroides]